MSSRTTIPFSLLFAIVLLGCGGSAKRAQPPTTEAPATVKTAAPESSQTWDLPIAMAR